MIITSKTPRLDLHGETTAMVNALISEFINTNYLLNNQFVIIIHGKSTNILTKEVHHVLAQNELVVKFKLNNWNLGETIVEIRPKLTK